jgi:hypothetical protein
MFGKKTLCVEKAREEGVADEIFVVTRSAGGQEKGGRKCNPL